MSRRTSCHGKYQQIAGVRYSRDFIDLANARATAATASGNTMTNDDVAQLLKLASYGRKVADVTKLSLIHI